VPHDLVAELVLSEDLVTDNANVVRDARFYMDNDVPVLL
jgi:hypothetical protein